MSLIIDSVIEYKDEDIREFAEIAERVCRLCFDEHGYDEDFMISIIFTNDDSIQEINRQYRDMDKPTDVLSFPMLESCENCLVYDETDVDKENNAVLLGDIIISFDKVKSQALEYNHSFQRETAFLSSHGMLHLLGYSHEKDEDEQKMRKVQEGILQKAGYLR